MYASRVEFPNLWEANWPAYRAIPTKRLIELLSALPDDTYVFVNQVGELSVATPADEPGFFLGEYLGYVAVGSEEWNPAE